MAEMLKGSWSTPGDKHRWTLKVLLLAGRRRDWPTAWAAGRLLLAEPSLDQTVRNIVLYDLAVAAHDCGELASAGALATEAALAYFDALELDPADLALASFDTTARILGDKVVSGDVKRLADALDMQATVRVRTGRNPGLAWLHAYKLYMLNGAHSSAIRVGKEIVENMLAIGDAPMARRTMENFMLPTVREFRLAHEVVPVRAQYAAVLAYCGEFDLARAVLDELMPYVQSLPEPVRLELESQRRVVEDVAAGTRALPPRVDVPPELMELWSRRNAQPHPRGPGNRGSKPPSKNALCPCGSGRKYKGCCLPKRG